MNFDFTHNPDGSFSLYNTEIGDIYFSDIGAYNEAIEKFVIPSKPENFKNKNIRILDVCYGMGYNSKAFVNYCRKNNLDFEFEIDCIELDKNILALGLLNFDNNISDDIHLKFGYELLNQIDLDSNIIKILGENWINHFLDTFVRKYNEFFNKKTIDLYQNNDFITLLHNIYYQNHDELDVLASDIKLNYLIGDLLEILPTLNNKYDLVFHDAFSIKKQPELWNDFVMEQYYNLLKYNGKFLTYSKSVTLLKTLKRTGFNANYIYVNNNKNSTIAIKNNSKLFNFLL